MTESVIIGVGLAVLAVAAWHAFFTRVNQRRGRAVVEWLHEAIAGYGQICHASWIDSSHLRLQLNLSLSGHAFRHPALEVKLAPRPMPLQWALWRWRHRQETLIFQANLSGAPNEPLEINRLRWSVFKQKGAAADWTSPRVAVSTLYICTQPAWQPQVSGNIHGVVATRDFEFLAVSFRPRTPHFSVTLSLEETLCRPGAELSIFQSLRELAQASSPSRM
jgi:hypothetical protein